MPDLMTGGQARWLRGGALPLLVIGLSSSMLLGGCGGGDATQTTKAISARPHQPQTPGPREIAASKTVPAASVRIEAVPGQGEILVDSAEKTLYRFSKDTRDSGKTHCYGACAELWYPKLSGEEPTASGAADPSLLGTIIRRDGYRQATYDGWPLYTNIKETSLEAKRAGAKSFRGTWYTLRANGESVK